MIRCTKAESDAIRAAANEERRTISGFVLYVVMNHIGSREALRRRLREKLEAGRKERHARGKAASEQ